tara:strand:- start:3126 stop:3749 length:624 start_codon:yes stop_codon:yes gene_type:complete
MNLVDKKVNARIVQAHGNYFIGIYQNERIRIFSGTQGNRDPMLSQLLRQVIDYTTVDLHLKALVTSERPGDPICEWSGPSDFFDKQDAYDQELIRSLISQREDVAQENLLPPVSSPYAPYVEPELPASRKVLPAQAEPEHKDEIQQYYENENPGLVLTKSQSRVQGKTDRELMIIIRVAAIEKGVQPCDVINEILWKAVRSGSVWDC